RRNLERVGEAADAGSVDLRLRLDSGGRLHQVAGEAIILRLGAPGRTLRALQPAAAGEREEGRAQSDFWPNATRHRRRMSVSPKERLNHAGGLAGAAVGGQTGASP